MKGAFPSIALESAPTMSLRLVMRRLPSKRQAGLSESHGNLSYDQHTFLNTLRLASALCRNEGLEQDIFG